MEKTTEFTRPEGHDCSISTGIHECLTFGSGELSAHGFWEYPCDECAREHERQFPEDGPCWPHAEKIYIPLEGHENCQIGRDRHGNLTFGSGKPDRHGHTGCWEHECFECAREHERQFPQKGPCWPHTQAYLYAISGRPFLF